MSRPRAARVLWAFRCLLFTTAWSCAADNTLSGSVQELFPLDVSRVEIRRNPEAVQVTYLNNRGADLDVVARVAISLDGVNFKPGQRISLGGEYTPGHARASVAHAPGGEPVRIFPPVKNGDLRLTFGGNIEEDTRGDFSMSFEESGGDLGQGRTLVGSFRGVILDGGFDPIIEDAGVP